MAVLAPPKALQATLLKKEPAGAQGVPQQVPREVLHIPASLLDKERRQELTNYLTNELQIAENERSEFINKLSRWKVAYKAPMPDGPKNFPIHNASNLTIPVIKEAVNTIVAQLVQATMTARPRWVIRDLAAEWETFTDEIENFLDLASDRDLMLDKPLTATIVEMCKLGTSIMAVEWEVDERKTYQYTANGAEVYARTQVRNDGPKAWRIPLQNFWIRFTETEIQKARWCAVEVDMTREELERKQDQGKFHSIDNFLRPDSTAPDKPTRDQQDIEKTQSDRYEKFKIFRMYVSFDIDGDGKMEETLLYFHKESSTLIGEFFTPYWHMKRPFVKFGYFPVEDRFYDEGLCEMLEQLQVGISSWVNRRGDNATLANLKMIIKRRMSRGINPGDPLYSGKIIEVNDIHNDMREFQMSEIYPSTVSEESLLQDRANRVSGMNEGTLGAAMPVSRTTASAQLALLQEQAKRIDLSVRNIRSGLNEVAAFTIDLYGQFGVNGKGIAWMGERGKIVEAIFRLPRRLQELGYAIKAQSPTSLQNKQVRRENKIAIYNLLVQAIERILPIAQQFAPEALPEVARGLVTGTRKFLVDTLETFDETDPESILASLTTLERILPRPEDLGGLGDFDRSVESAEMFTQLQRVESLLREAEAVRDDTSRVRPDKSTRRLSAPEGSTGGRENRLGPGGESTFRP